MELNEIDRKFELAVEMPADAFSPSFEVTDMKKAEWAVKKIAQRRARIAEFREYANAKIEQINAWLEGECQPLEDDIAYFEGLLRPFAEAELAKSKKKTKTVKLPNGGKLSFRAAQPKFDYAKADLVAFLQEGGYSDYIEMEAKPKWNDFKNACTITEDGLVTPDGELVACVTVVPAEEDAFSVDAKGVIDNE